MDNTETNRNNEKIKLSRAKTMKEKKGKISFPKNKDNDTNSIKIFVNKYNQPIADSQQNNDEIIYNQRFPTTTSFKSNPIHLTCPYCKKEIISEIKESCNCCTCLMFLFIIALCAIPCLFLSGFCNLGNCNCSGCDCKCCCDIIHICPKCKKVIGIHDSFPTC